MITIPVTVTGDHWLNPEHVYDALAKTNPQEHVVLDIRAEGPSLQRLGVIAAVMDQCQKLNRDPSTVSLSRWSNPVESVPFARMDRSDVSHFFWISERYRPGSAIQCVAGHLYGFFMGRPTMARLSLLHELSLHHDALLSVMNGGFLPRDQGINQDRQEFHDLDCAALQAWYQDIQISSLDGATIRDQYNAECNTNLSLLAHYHRFHIEIVAESYVLGETYFPTEKTVRPIAAGKPFIVMGPRFFLRRLQDQGFRTWGDHWDESYDDLEGRDRLNRIKKLIADIAVRRDSIVPHLEVEHNRLNLQTIIQRYQPAP